MDRLVIAADLGDASADAARYALRLARSVGADLTVLHVVGSDELTPDAITSYRYQLHEPSRDAHDVVADATREEVQRVREWFRSVAGEIDGVTVSYQVAFGDVAPTVLATASDTHADAIVVGVPERGMLGRNLTEILLGARVPVIAIHQGTHP